MPRPAFFLLTAGLLLAACRTTAPPAGDRELFYQTQSGRYYESSRWHKALTPEIGPILDANASVYEWYTVERTRSGAARVHREYWSPSLDWHVRADYRYGRDGRLREVDWEYATHLGLVAATGNVLPVKVTRTLRYDSAGQVTDSKEEVLSERDGKPVEVSYPPKEPRPWLTLAELPQPPVSRP